MDKGGLFKPFPEEKILSDLEELRIFIGTFDYASLRQVQVPGGDKTSCYASPEATRQLFDFFCHHFLYSPEKSLRELYKGIDQWSVDKKHLIITLGNLLISFREKIEISEMQFFERSGKAVERGELQLNSMWVRCFHFMIEKYLDKMGVEEGDYFNFVKNIQNLGEKIFAWVSKNSSEDTEKYNKLSSPDARPIFAVSEEEKGNIKKLF